MKAKALISLQLVLHKEDFQGTTDGIEMTEQGLRFGGPWEKPRVGAHGEGGEPVQAQVLGRQG